MSHAAGEGSCIGTLGTSGRCQADRKLSNGCPLVEWPNWKTVTGGADAGGGPDGGAMTGTFGVGLANTPDEVPVDIHIGNQDGCRTLRNTNMEELEVLEVMALINHIQSNMYIISNTYVSQM